MQANRFDDEIKGIVADVDTFIDSLPEPLRGMGQEFAWEGYPYRQAFVGNDMAFPGLYLPFWIADCCRDSADFSMLLDHARKIVLGALLGYLYIRIQDDVYDHKDGNNPASLLLANEFIRRMYDLYHDLFPADSAFWVWFRRFWQEFSQATAWEIKTCRDQIRPLTQEELDIVGRKLSFAKVPVAAVLLKAGRVDDLPAVSTIVDMLATSSQLLNDFASLERDLGTRHFTYPLSAALHPGDVHQRRDLDQLLFQRMLQTESLEQLFDRTLALDKEVLERLEGFPIPHLDIFVRSRIALVDQMRQRYLKIKFEALLGVN